MMDYSKIILNVNVNARMDSLIKRKNCLCAGLIYVNKIIKHATISVLTLLHLLFVFAEFLIMSISTKEMKNPRKKSELKDMVLVFGATYDKSAFK